MEAINELLPLIATVLLLVITIYLVMTHYELMNIRDELQYTNSQLKGGLLVHIYKGGDSALDVNVVNPVSIYAPVKDPLNVAVQRWHEVSAVRVESY